MSKHNTQHIPSQPEAPKQVPYLVANQGIIQNIDSILNQSYKDFEIIDFGKNVEIRKIKNKR